MNIEEKSTFQKPTLNHKRSVFDRNTNTADKQAHEKSANPKTTLVNNLGALRSNIKLTLHTRPAVNLWQGRTITNPDPKEQRASIIGIPRFAEIARQLESSSSNDDPYADFWFGEIYQRISGAREYIREQEKQIDEIIADNIPEGFEVSTALSLSPLTVPVAVGSILGFLAIYLVADFDKLARKVMQASHIALITRKVAENIQERAKREIRGALTLVTRWHFTGATRDDFAANNQRARMAVDRMGPLSDDILHGINRHPAAPELRRKNEKFPAIALIDAEEISQTSENSDE